MLVCVVLLIVLVGFKVCFGKVFGFVMIVVYVVYIVSVYMFGYMY